VHGLCLASKLIAQGQVSPLRFREQSISVNVFNKKPVHAVMTRQLLLTVTNSVETDERTNGKYIVHLDFVPLN
jgi:hypothetical protein